MPGTTPSSPMLLSEWAKRSGSAQAMKLVDCIYRGDSPLKFAEMVTSTRLVKSVAQNHNSALPTNQFWRNLNEQAPEARSGSRLVTAPMHLLAATMSVDAAVYDDWMAHPTEEGDPFDAEYKRTSAKIGFDFDTCFFLNDRTDSGVNSSKAPAGLWYRLQNSASRLAEYQHNSQCVIDGGGLDITLATGTAANALRVLELMRRLATKMGSAKSKKLCFFANDQVWRNLDTLLATGTFYKTTDNQFEQTMTTYMGWKLIDVLKQADGSTDIIPLVENAAGTALSGGSFTSIYAVDFDPDKTHFWQRKTLKPEKLARNGVFYEALIDYGVGWLNASDRGQGRVFNVKA